ncbi:MAG: DUF721 domain-containing protein [Bacteroidales bacterium]|nr:DUF721 domain-containing protein [Bacteroidales bacterium]
MENQTKFSSWKSAMNNVRMQKKTFDKNPIFIHPSIFVRMEELAIKQKWKEVVGDLFAKHATLITIENEILYVTVNSAAIKHELTMNKSNIITRMNNELGKIAVRDIIMR